MTEGPSKYKAMNDASRVAREILGGVPSRAVEREAQMSECVCSVLEPESRPCSSCALRAALVGADRLHEGWLRILDAIGDPREAVLQFQNWRDAEYDGDPLAKKYDARRVRREKMRRGQWLWNQAMVVFPHATEATRGTAADCFYDDEKVADFLRALVERAREGCIGCGKVLVVPEENKPYWCGECVTSGRMQSATPSKLEAIEKFARDNPRASMGQLVDLFFGARSG